MPGFWRGNTKLMDCRDGASPLDRCGRRVLLWHDSGTPLACVVNTRHDFRIWSVVNTILLKRMIHVGRVLVGSSLGIQACLDAVHVGSREHAQSGARGWWSVPTGVGACSDADAAQAVRNQIAGMSIGMSIGMG